jgi:hypothetical protein
VHLCCDYLTTQTLLYLNSLPWASNPHPAHTRNRLLLSMLHLVSITRQHAKRHTLTAPNYLGGGAVLGRPAGALMHAHLPRHSIGVQGQCQVRAHEEEGLANPWACTARQVRDWMSFSAFPYKVSTRGCTSHISNTVYVYAHDANCPPTALCAASDMTAVYWMRSAAMVTSQLTMLVSVTYMSAFTTGHPACATPVCAAGHPKSSQQQ